MRNIFIIISLLILSGCQTTGLLSAIDKNWNVNFYSNCGLPKDSLKTIEENENKFLRFKLEGGQKGGCNSDRRRRHGAHFWERSELKQSSRLHRNSVYKINFKVRFISGFKGNRESFFQIHQSDTGCTGHPLLMLKFSEGYLRGDKIFEINNLIGNWVNFKIILNLIDETYTVYINEDLFMDEKYFSTSVTGCARPHIKFGIYRPGFNDVNGSITNNDTSIVDFDNIRIAKIK